MKLSAEQFRQVLGHLPTGVTVMTADGESPVGMAANSVTSVSLDPPMVLVCPAKSSSTWPLVRAVGRFCVNVMAGHHEAVCRQFAVKDAADRFAGVGWHPRPAGPALDEAVAWIECEITAEHEAGDHTVVLAEVVAMEARSDRPPLVFFQGRYGTFNPAAPSMPAHTR